ncbi:MBL fold metallo-hydrolase [Aeromicrobium sp. CF4.19]|uniref:MBL fold metallo-hydrolase n=1 Tax=Aeromicrobium sp. CF4.19 TaxID=3373082 RepID=UPI003EE657A2
MRVEHLSCGLMTPPGMPAIPAHVLLCHTDMGLVLVDSGFGTADLADPRDRLGPMRHLLRPVRDEAHTALRQLQARGHHAEEVTHVVLTHLDLDHVGGIADFPAATIHMTAYEHAAAVTSPDVLDKARYRTGQLAHQPVVRTHDGRGDEWRYGLTAHEVLPGIALVPMPGHSRGHAAVAVDADGGTIVHAGDAVFDASCYTDATPGGLPLSRRLPLRSFERVVGRDQRAISRNHRTLRRLDQMPGVTVVPAHDARITGELVGT